MADLQYIQDSNGKPLFVVVPFDKFQEMELLSRFAIETKEEQGQYEEIPVETGKTTARRSRMKSLILC